MKAEILSNAVGDLIREHHEAFAVELLGPEAAGVSPERIAYLLERGLVDPARLAGVKIPTGSNQLDPFMFLRMIGQLAEGATPDMRDTMRTWTLAEWLPHVDAEVARSWRQGALPLAAQVGVSLPKPPPPAEPTALPGADEAPAWLSRSQKNSYVQARTRAGEFARGLGNRLAVDVEQTISEAWAGEDIVQEVDAERRAATVEIIAEQTAEAVAQGKSARELARNLASTTERWAHDWRRIAETELQGAYSDGVVIDAIETYGEEAQVARIPESGACDSCVSLFTSGGRPIVFSVADLLAAGTNVGRKQAQWQATIWPVHPRCRCDTITVPPGMTVDETGRLRRSKT